MLAKMLLMITKLEIRKRQKKLLKALKKQNKTKQNKANQVADSDIEALSALLSQIPEGEGDEILTPLRNALANKSKDKDSDDVELLDDIINNGELGDTLYNMYVNEESSDDTTVNLDDVNPLK